MKFPSQFLIGCIIGLTVLCVSVPARAERVFFAGYKGGFYIRSEEEGGMELRLGGSFQADYRYYCEESRSDNRFDIRRARLIFNGELTQWFRFGLEYEFQGNEIKHLIDAYGEFAYYAPHAVRFGQFKEPFSFEWQTRDKALYFAERSIGYYLTPKRDVGIMFSGSFGQESLDYAVGFFNGDGVDGSTKGRDHDEPEFAARLVYSPFKRLNNPWLKSLQFGSSLTYAAIDVTNVNLDVKSAGMAGTDRSIYVLTHDTKFGVLKDVGERIRYGLEAAWAKGPLVVAGEYTQLKYTELEPVSKPSQDAQFSAYYLSAVYFITGEQPILSGGAMQPVVPNRYFNPQEETFGALCLGARVEHFDGDRDWIRPAAFVSVEKADAFTIAGTWLPFPMVRLILDWTHTRFSDPIRVRVNPDGTVDYVDKENVLTLRLSMDF